MNPINWKVTSKFLDDINTDDIIRADILQETIDKNYFAKHAFEKFDADFIKRSSENKSNIIVAWKNFWCWSSREQAVYALSFNKVICVIAESFPDIFYRNSVNNWFLLIRLDDTSKILLWSELEINLESKQIIDKSNNAKYLFEYNESDLELIKSWWRLQIVKNYIKNPKCNITRWPWQRWWKTIVEKMISNKINSEVFAWDTISALPIDLIYLNEVIGPPAIAYFKNDFWENSRVFNNEKIKLIPDHSIPSCSIAVSNWIEDMKQFAKNEGIKMYKQGRWIEHIVFIEEWKVLPWNIILWTDSHTCTNWALNTLSLWVWTTDSVFALAAWAIFNFTVPESIKVNLKWNFQKWTSAKDLILYITWIIWAKWASKKIIEFDWPAISNLSIDQRTTISNMAVEMSARSWIFPFDEKIWSYLKEKWLDDFAPVSPDEQANYTQTIEIDLDSIKPMVAFPHSPDNVCEISKLNDQIKKSKLTNSPSFPSIKDEDLNITQWFIWSCTNWKYEDLELAAKVLKWNKVSENVDLIIVPASDQIFKKALKNWLIEIFLDSWAMIEAPNCWTCFWKHLWVAWQKSRIISSSNRNYKWRMWHQNSLIFLASPATVAASSIEWAITSPIWYL